MEGLFSTIGTAVITIRMLYWVTAIGSIGVILCGVVSAYVLPEPTGFGILNCSDESDKMKMLAQWVLYTNAVGLVSAIMFLYTNKGTTTSVTGCIVWILNFLQGIVLFFYT